MVYLSPVVDPGWPRCPRCHSLLSNGEVSRFVAATSYCWCCYPNQAELVAVLLGIGQEGEETDICCTCECHNPHEMDDPACPCREDEQLGRGGQR